MEYLLLAKKITVYVVGQRTWNLEKVIGILSKAGGVMTVVLKYPAAEGLTSAERRAERIGGFSPKSYTINSLGWKG